MFTGIKVLTERWVNWVALNGLNYNGICILSVFFQYQGNLAKRQLGCAVSFFGETYQ